ncbi:glycosyltransferase family 2 protein [Balneolaceae bacterium ANBcel3]|nr:glycosyltransferase family 2 protein [Balneolaceae bacterium ANBcel3]
MPRVSIIIVSWNALNHLKTFLPSVWNHSHSLAEIIIADNDSSDDSNAWVRAHFPEVRIAELDQNYGYCGGNNRAALQANGEYLLFLNNDVEVSSGWLEPLIRMMDEHPDVGAIQPKIRSVEQPASFEYAGAAGGLLDRHGYPYCLGRIFDHVEEDKGQYDTVRPISWASGAAIMTRKTLFSELGGFDESFVFHMEEIDYCWRLRQRDYKIMNCPSSVVYHLGGGSLPSDSPRKRYYNFRNNLKMLFKNLPRKKLFTILPVRLLLDMIATFQTILRLEWRMAFEMIRARWHFYASIPDLIAYRKSLSINNIEPSPYVLRPYSILWHYFIKKKKTFGDLPESGF